MDPRLQLALQLLQAIPALLEAGHDITALVNDTTAKLEDMAATGRNPTDEEWNTLNATIAGLRGELHKG